MKLLLKAVCLCAIIICAAACKKTQTNTFTKNDLPAMQTGSWWRYRDLDSLTGRVDTLTLTIASSSTSGSTKTFQCNITNGNALADSGTIMVSDTGFSFTSHLLRAYKYKIPFTVGNDWQSTGGGVEIFGTELRVVSHNDHYQVLGHIYDAFLLHSSDDTADAGLQEDFQIARGVGMVYLTYTYSSWGPYQNRTEQLIDYHL